MPHMIIYGSCGSDGPKLASEILKRFFSKNEIKVCATFSVIVRRSKAARFYSLLHLAKR